MHWPVATTSKGSNIYFIPVSELLGLLVDLPNSALDLARHGQAGH